ncbi:MAG: hypothetical protein ABIO72_02550 [Patescibacteria group bacterium]
MTTVDYAVVAPSIHDPENLTPARLAEALAHLAFFERDDEDAVLTQLGHDPRVFRAEAIHVKAVLAAAVHADQPDLLTSYTSAYEVTLRVLRARRPKLSQARRDPNLEPTKTKRSAAAPPALVPLPERAGAPKTADVLLPSYLQPPPKTGPMRDLETVDETGIVDARKVLAGSRLPFVDPKDAPPMPRAKRDLAPSPSSDDPGSGTVMMRLPAEVRRTLPFAKEPPPTPESAAIAADVELYATLAKALASDADRARVLERFGLTEESRHRLTELWADRMESDAELKERFTQLVRGERTR